MLTPDSLYGPTWLLTYEADVHGWLRPTKRGIVRSDANFAPLKAANVSFFDESVVAPTKTLLFGVPATSLTVYGGGVPPAPSPGK
jgi:hypothetical protein